MSQQSCSSSYFFPDTDEVPHQSSGLEKWLFSHPPADIQPPHDASSVDSSVSHRSTRRIIFRPATPSGYTTDLYIGDDKRANGSTIAADATSDTPATDPLIDDLNNASDLLVDKLMAVREKYREQREIITAEEKELTELRDLVRMMQGQGTCHCDGRGQGDVVRRQRGRGTRSRPLSISNSGSGSGRKRLSSDSVGEEAAGRRKQACSRVVGSEITKSCSQKDVRRTYSAQ